MTDPPWTERLRQLIQQYPTFGYRRLWVLLRFRDGLRINQKAFYCVLKQNGWCVHQRVAVIDCHDREVMGYEFALRSRAKEAERAVEAACLQRFWTLRPVGAPVLRSDNDLIFQSRRF